MESNRRFLRQEQAETDALFDEVEAEMEAEAEEEPELRLPHVPGARNRDSGHLRRQRVA